MELGQAGDVGPASKRYWRIAWIGIFLSIFIGGLTAPLLDLSPFITMGVTAVLLFLATLPLALAARRERLEREKHLKDTGPV
jgi:hypothetical protein